MSKLLREISDEEEIQIKSRGQQTTFRCSKFQAKKFDVTIEVDFEEMLQALNRIRPAIEQFLLIEINSDTATLSAYAPDGAIERKTTVSIKAFPEGLRKSFSINAAFLKEALLTAKIAQIHLAGDDGPLCVKANGYAEHIALARQ